MRYIAWPLYWAVTFILCSIIFWQRTESETISYIEKFIVKNSGILTSLGTLFALSFIAYATTIVAGQLAERREKINRRTQVELKISEFRQSWIDEFRNDLSIYSVLLFKRNPDKEENNQRMRLEFKIFARLNLDEPRARDLSDKIFAARGLADSDDATARNDAFTALSLASNKFLRFEWKRLKQDIRRARLLDEDRL